MALTHWRRGLVAALALLILGASTALAVPYQRTVQLKFTRTGTGLRYPVASPGLVGLTYADSFVRNSGTGQRLDTLYFRVPDRAPFSPRSTSGALVDSTRLFDFWVIPSPNSAVTIAADSAYVTLAGSIGPGGPGIAGMWMTGLTEIPLEINSLNAMVASYQTQINTVPPATATNITMGYYNSFRVIAQGDYTGQYNYFITYWADSEAPDHKVQGP